MPTTEKLKQEIADAEKKLTQERSRLQRLQNRKSYDCGSFVVNGTAVVGKEPKKPYNRCKSTQKGADSYEISIRGNGWHLPSGG